MARKTTDSLDPMGIWKGYDPAAEPLDEQVLRQWRRGGVAYKEVFFTGLTHQGQAVRVLAMYAAPVGGRKLPGVLHVHGGGQTCDPKWLAFWTRRGYAALTFDWGGVRPERDHATEWGPLQQARQCQHNNTSLAAGVTGNAWYLWTLATRRAITYFQAQPEVDARRIGAFGISMGGTLLWNLAVDPRVKAGCAIYGVGQNTYRSAQRHDPLNQPKPLTDEEARWVACLSPEACADVLKFPMLFLSATNDTHGDMDRAFDTFDRVPASTPQRWAFTPRYIHHVGAAESRNLPLWMDQHLRGGKPLPKTPEVSLELAPDGTPVLRVRPDLSQSVRKVDVLYAVENLRPYNRHWRDARPVRREGRSWSAALPVMDVSQPLFAFAAVHYASGACLSGRLLVATPADLGPARATDAWCPRIHDSRHGLDGFLDYCRSTEPLPPFPLYMHAATGPGGRRGIAIRRGACTFTYKLGDPKWRGRPGLKLSLDVAASKAQDLLIHLRTGADYTAKVSLPARKGWQTLTLDLGDFISAKDNTSLPDWQSVHTLEVRRGEGKAHEVFVADVRWE